MPANINDVDGLPLSQEGKPQTYSGKCQIARCINISLTYNEQIIIKYHLRLKCRLVRRRRQIRDAQLIMPVLSMTLSEFSAH